MSKDKGKTNALLVGITSRQTRASSSRKNNDNHNDDDNDNNNEKGKNVENANDIADSKALAIIQEKISKFQPKINPLLPRMLGKGNSGTSNAMMATTVATDAATSKSTNTAEKGTSSGNKSKSAIKSAVSPAVATTKESTSRKNKEKATAATTSTATNSKKPLAAAGSSSKSKSKKSPAPSGASIVTLIPKGSRSRPLPQKAQESDRQDTPTEPNPTTRSKNRSDEVIVLSSSLASASSVWEGSPYDVNEKSYSAGDLEEEMELEPEQVQQSSKSSKKYDRNPKPNTVVGSSAPASTKMPSVISLDSTKSFEFASAIPSVKVDRIADWMGGVKQAMEQDNEEESHSTTPPPAAAKVAPEAKNKGNSAASTKVEEAEHSTEVRKPILRRPPPGIPRHATSTTGFSPSPATVEATASPDVALSSPEEHGHLTSTLDEHKKPNKGKNVLIQDSLSTLPSFQEISESGGSIVDSSIVNPSSSLSQLRPNKIPAAGGNYHDDDISTVLGQPTQDSVGGLESFSSSKYESAESGSMEDKDYELEQEEYQEPSLPSALTSSCLQELGLKRKSGRQERDTRKRHSRGRLSPAKEEGEKEDTGDNMILAQMEAFPSSIADAPVSSSFQSLAPSPDVLNTPEYVHALPDRARRDNEEQNRHQGQTQAQALDQESDNQAGLRDVSFPSPPTQITFSTLPSMPSFPSQLQSEPSLILLGSQNPNQNHKNGEES
ncbi:hypothetical protein BGZ49_004036 [Haplosporangium sp. Z 27]|nr:hypothetical protein BGZ49_004036 [Haplosporangium sp. Z 27]